MFSLFSKLLRHMGSVDCFFFAVAENTCRKFAVVPEVVEVLLTLYRMAQEAPQLALDKETVLSADHFLHEKMTDL